jgi:hypothetical protein
LGCGLDHYLFKVAGVKWQALGIGNESYIIEQTKR